MNKTDEKLNRQPSGRSSGIMNNMPAIAAILLILIIWQAVCSFGIVPTYLLPSPADVVRAMIGDADLLARHSVITLQEAIYGLVIGVVLGILTATLMDMFDILYRASYPILVITQTIPTIAIAPLLILWFGFEMTPKVILIVLATFFPLSVGLLDGFRSVDKDQIDLLRSMGAGRWKLFRYVKFPSALPNFFSGLKIATSYSVVTAVVSEWLGGFMGLGVYMTKVKKAYAFDKMFAVIILISLVSLIMIFAVSLIEKKCMPYRNAEKIR
jgi:ABC-type nitrate/sulfonate/bicarbonate transport system permease component